MNRLNKITVITLLFFPFFTNTTYAAGMGMGMGVPCGGPFPPCPVPLDSSVVLLLTAGALYGAYKIYNSLKKNPA